MPVDRNDGGWHLVGGDEEVNDKIEMEAAKAEVVSIPSKLKAVIKFGYDQGWKEAFAGTDFDEWIAAVFTHTQAHYKDPSMGTEVTFEVLFRFPQLLLGFFYRFISNMSRSNTLGSRRGIVSIWCFLDS